MPSNIKAFVGFFAARLSAIVLFAFLGLIAGGFAGSTVVNNAPGLAAGVVQPLLCPAKTIAKIDSVFGEWYTSPNGGHVRDETKIVRCFNAQGVEQPANKPLTFYSLWFGFWLSAGAILAALAGGLWLDWSGMPRL